MILGPEGTSKRLANRDRMRENRKLSREFGSRRAAKRKRDTQTPSASSASSAPKRSSSQKRRQFISIEVTHAIENSKEIVRLLKMIVETGKLSNESVMSEYLLYSLRMIVYGPFATKTPPRVQQLFQSVLCQGGTAAYDTLRARA